jgi:hypothetical protein
MLRLFACGEPHPTFQELRDREMGSGVRFGVVGWVRKGGWEVQKIKIKIRKGGKKK